MLEVVLERAAQSWSWNSQQYWGYGFWLGDPWQTTLQMNCSLAISKANLSHRSWQGKPCEVEHCNAPPDRECPAKSLDLDLPIWIRIGIARPGRRESFWPSVTLCTVYLDFITIDGWGVFPMPFARGRFCWPDLAHKLIPWNLTWLFLGFCKDLGAGHCADCAFRTMLRWLGWFSATPTGKENHYKIQPASRISQKDGFEKGGLGGIQADVPTKRKPERGHKDWNDSTKNQNEGTKPERQYKWLERGHIRQTRPFRNSPFVSSQNILTTGHISDSTVSWKVPLRKEKRQRHRVNRLSICLQPGHVKKQLVNSKNPLVKAKTLYNLQPLVGPCSKQMFLLADKVEGLLDFRAL